MHEIGARVREPMNLCLSLLEAFIVGRVLSKLSTGGGKVKDFTLACFHLVTVLGDRNLKTDHKTF